VVRPKGGDASSDFTVGGSSPDKAPKTHKDAYHQKEYEDIDAGDEMGSEDSDWAEVLQNENPGDNMPQDTPDKDLKTQDPSYEDFDPGSEQDGYNKGDEFEEIHYEDINSDQSLPDPDLSTRS
jgi:hypothetical protein